MLRGGFATEAVLPAAGAVNARGSPAATVLGSQGAAAAAAAEEADDVVVAGGGGGGGAARVAAGAVV